MNKIITLLLLGFAFKLQAQIKSSIDYLQSDRNTPLQAEDISPMNNGLQPAVPPALRFPAGEEKNYLALPSLQREADVRDGLHFVRTPDTNLPYFIKGTPYALNTGAALSEQYAQYFEIVKADMQIENPQEEFQQTHTETDRLGITHTRFEQFYLGVKVYDSEVILHAKEGKIHLFNGRFFPTPELTDLTPGLSETAAFNKVKAELGEANEDSVNPGFEFLTAAEVLSSELIIYHHEGKIDAEKLTWHITYIPSLADRWEVFVDAETGEILHKFNNVCRFHFHSEGETCAHDVSHAGQHTASINTKANSTNLELVGPETAQATDLLGVSRTINVYETGGTYFMIDAARNEMFNNAQSDFPNEPVGVVWTIDAMNNNVEGDNFELAHVTDNDNNWNNPTGVSAQFNAGAAYEYFQDVHNRTSINGEGGNIVSIVNVQDGNGAMDNAFWNGAAIFYGNGISAFQPLARGLDVAGHEMSHGVIQATANLEYQGESGALNESFADIFGAMIDRNDWQIGEDVVNTSAFPSGALRDMADPNQGGNSLSDPGYQPAHTNEQFTGSADNGGVHINSGIANKAFHLFATDIGKDKAEEIYYYALTNYLVRSSQFIDCRAAIEQSASDLYGNGEVQAAQNAFSAVGIGSGGSTGGGANGGDSQDDFEVNPGEDYILLSDVSQDQLYLFTPDGTAIANPLSTVSPISRPSITDDGTAIVYIDESKTMQLIILDWDAGTFDQSTLNGDPIWRNVAVAKDGTRIAALTDDNDNRIYVYDFTLETGQFFDLYNPTYTQGISTGDVLFADVLEWDYSGNWVMYDAFNRIEGNFGSDIEYWDIGFINVFNHGALQFGNGTVEKLFSGLPEDVSVGNPTFSKNSDYIIAFDYIDEFQQEYSLRAANLEAGDVGVIFNNSKLSWPNYSTDDNQIVFDATTQNGTDVLAFVPIGSDKISASGDATVFLDNGHRGVWFAEGFRDFVDNDNPVFGGLGARVAPNPFTNNLQLEFDLLTAGEVGFELTDIQGKVLRSQKVNFNSGLQSYNMETSGVPSGTYFLRILTHEGAAVLKLVKTE